MENYLIAGRVGENKEEELLVLFNNTELPFEEKPIDIMDFNVYCRLDEVEDFETITKSEFTKLLGHPLYSDFKGYSVQVIKGMIPELDIFSFGCGKIEVFRREIEALLKLFKVVKPSELVDLIELLDDVDNADSAITDKEVPLIKMMLSEL